MTADTVLDAMLGGGIGGLALVVLMLLFHRGGKP